MAAYIAIGDRKIPKGIFHFVYDVTGDEKLADSFFQMEKHYFTKPEAFASEMRRAMEDFFFSEYQRVYGATYDPSCSSLAAKEIISNHLLQEKEGNPMLAKVTSPLKIFLVLRCCTEQAVPYFNSALLAWKNKNNYTPTDLKYAIFDCYSFACSPHHEDPRGINTYGPFQATPENCQKYLKFLYHFLRGYFLLHYPDQAQGIDPLFKDSLIPMEDYVRVPEQDRKALGIPSVPRKSLYICENGASVSYYWICTRHLETQQNREVDVLQKLWAEDNDYDPQNVIRLKQTLMYQGQPNKLVFSLPSLPMLLTWTSVLDSMSLAERKKIFADALHAIESLHNTYPPLYHRDISPMAFVICKTRSSHKLFLCAFDCVKDTDPNVSVTMGNKVAENMAFSQKRPYLSPEILDLKNTDDAWLAIDWKKADIYALGMLGVYILTGTTDPQALDQSEELDDATRCRIRSMLAPIDQRPTTL